MFLLIFHYPHFLITSCIHAFENYVQSVVLYGLSEQHVDLYLDALINIFAKRNVNYSEETP